MPSRARWTHLRRELMAEGAPISVTSIKPGTINTPFFNNSLNKMDVKPKGPPPVYDPVILADCVLYAAENPVRDFCGRCCKNDGHQPDDRAEVGRPHFGECRHHIPANG
ncbi:MAG: hypothetical protein ACJ746_09305 [Bryobacteraceae bacterium]